MRRDNWVDALKIVMKKSKKAHLEWLRSTHQKEKLAAGVSAAAINYHMHSQTMRLPITRLSSNTISYGSSIPSSVSDTFTLPRGGGQALARASTTLDLATDDNRASSGRRTPPRSKTPLVVPRASSAPRSSLTVRAGPLPLLRAGAVFREPTSGLHSLPSTTIFNSSRPPEPPPPEPQPQPKGVLGSLRQPCVGLAPTTPYCAHDRHALTVHRL